MLSQYMVRPKCGTEPNTQLTEHKDLDVTDYGKFGINDFFLVVVIRPHVSLRASSYAREGLFDS